MQQISIFFPEECSCEREAKEHQGKIAKDLILQADGVVNGTTKEHQNEITKDLHRHFIQLVIFIIL